MVKWSNLASKVQNFSRIIAPRKIAPNPKSNPNPNLNPNHNPVGGRDNFPRGQLSGYLTKHI